MDYILLIIGFILLIKGADYFVEGSSSVAKLMHIPSIIIGLTVVAFGTSLPELSVSLTASLRGANELAVGNVVGSNIFNVFIVLGASALITTVYANKEVLKKEFPFSIIIVIGLFFLMGGYRISDLVSGNGQFVLTRIGGLILLALFIGFIVSTVRDALRARSAYDAPADKEEYKILSPLRSAIYIVGGCAGIGFGGDMVVKAASAIGESFGMSEGLIGLTIVALGTSLPELVTSMVAAKKGENDLAIGNVVGSNIFNVLLILGVSASISPITVSVSAMYDIILSVVASIIVYVCAKSNTKITRKEGSIFLIGYLLFFIYILMR